MRAFKSMMIATAAMLTISFSAFAGKKPIDTKKSSIHWVGKKVTGEHSGTINFKNGAVELNHGHLVGGSFVVDMNSINTTDLEGGYKAKLDGHLKADDFFGVAKYPEASFVITHVDGDKVSGDLTIKGHTEKSAFVLTKKGNSIEGDVKINRTKFGIKYGSKSFFDNLKDKAINDEFELTVKIVF